MSEILIAPVATEKAIRAIEEANALCFVVARRASKPDIASEFQRIFKVRPVGIRTVIRGSQKRAWIVLPKASPAIDIATKLGMM